MIALAWNCQDLGSTLIVQALKELKNKFDPDFVFLMEMKNKIRKVDRLRRRMRYEK
ncbi:hypothetical protein REPUB_Repub02eG0182700 [Reevesia pubescens]